VLDNFNIPTNRYN